MIGSVHLKQVQKVKASAIISLANVGCSALPTLIERELKNLHGIERVEVDYITDSVLVNFDPTTMSIEEVREYMKKLSLRYRQTR